MRRYKTLLFWVVIAILFRLFLMPFSLHSDLWAISFSEYLFSFKGVVNIYDYLANLSPDSLLRLNYGQNFFTYPPLAYFTFGIFGLILKPLFNARFFDNLALNLPTILEQKELYCHLFLTKLPYLFFDLGIFVLFWHLFSQEKSKKLAMVLWLFNPLSLYTTYMIGQFDIIPVFFVVLSLFLVKKNKEGLAALCLGVGGAYKMFPLFFVPFLALTQGKNIYQKVKLFVLGMLPYVLSILPFLGSTAFRENVPFSNQSQKMLFAKLNVSGAEYLSIFILFFVFLLFLTSLKKLELWKWFLLVMLLFFSLTHYHPQWFLWLSPFLVFLLVDYPSLRGVTVLLFICWFIIMLLFEPSLSISLFAPVFNNLSHAISFSEVIARYYDVFQLKSIVRSIFAGLALFTSVRLFSKNASD